MEDTLVKFYYGSNQKIKDFLSTIKVVKTVPRFDQIFENDKDVKNILYEQGEFSFISTVRCTNCGKLIVDSDLIIQMILNGYKFELILSLLGYTRMCCRNTIFSSPYMQRYIDYYNNIYEKYLNLKYT